MERFRIYLFILQLIAYFIIAFGCYMLGYRRGRQADKLYTFNLANLTSCCMICKNKVRLDELSVISHHIGRSYGFEKPSDFIVNVRYCRNNIICRELAGDSDHWKGWREERISK